jgi:broad specificity phosphatase PhoE
VGKERDSTHGKEFVAALLAHHGEPGWHYEDEESYFEMHERAVRLISHIEERPERHILLVSHAGFLRSLITAMMTEGEPNPALVLQLQRFLKPMNTGVTIFEHYPMAVRRNKWRMITWNDHAHLAETVIQEPHE